MMDRYKTENISFPSAGGNDTIKGKAFVPDRKPRAIVQISHGMCEYTGRYRDFMGFLAEHGFIAACSDHCGHGDSSVPERYGYFAEKDGHRVLVEDLHTMTGILRERYGDLPVFLFGHSMGSFIARLYAEQYGPELSGAVFCGTAGPDPMTYPGILLSGIIAKIRGPFHRSALLDRIAFSSFNRRCRPLRTSKDWLTKDTSVVDRYLNDPRCMFTFTASGFRDLMRLITESNRRSWAANLEKDLPLYLISGTEDPVGGYGKGVRKVFDMLRSAGCRDVSIRMYDGDRHEILNETDRSTVYKETLEWIESRL